MIYPSIRIEGAILSPDILEKLEEIPGQRSVDFGLDPSVKVKDEIAAHGPMPRTIGASSIASLKR